MLIVENAIGLAFPARELAAVFERAIILDTILGFLFGFAVYWKWRYQSAFWMAAIGVACRIAMRMTHADDPVGFGNSATLAFVSVRCVMYSPGAGCCRWWFGSGVKSAEQTTPK